MRFGRLGEWRSIGLRGIEWIVAVDVCYDL